MAYISYLFSGRVPCILTCARVSTVMLSPFLCIYYQVVTVMCELLCQEITVMQPPLFVLILRQFFYCHAITFVCINYKSSFHCHANYFLCTDNMSSFHCYVLIFRATTGLWSEACCLCGNSHCQGSSPAKAINSEPTGGLGNLPC